MKLQATWLEMFEHVFRLCGVQPGDACAVLSESATRPELPQLAELALARAQKRPDWSLELIYAQRGPAFSNMLSLQFRVGLPVFARARQAPSIRSKQASLERVEAEREAARRMYVTELRKSLIAWRSAAKRVRLYEQDLLPLADDRAAVALAAYQSGTGDLAATLATLDAAIETRLAYSDLLDTLAQAWASLHFAFPEGS